MPHFETVIYQKQKLREVLLQNQMVVNLLVNTGNNIVEFEDVPTGSKSPASGLIKTHFYVPGTTAVDKNFITMRSRIIYSDTNVVKEVGLYVYVICNEDQIDLLQGSRADLLADEVDKVLNRGDKQLFGLDNIQLYPSAETQFAAGYSGWELSYMVHEKNRRVDLI